MARPTKLTYEIQQRIGDNIALGLPYSLAVDSVEISYQTFNQWIQRGRNSTSGRYFEFYQHIQQRNAEGALKLLERLNEAAKAGGTRICLWILERRFSDEFGRRGYRKTNAISENLNQNVDLIANDTDGIRKQILAKFDRF
jgi:hypothetical protein